MIMKNKDDNATITINVKGDSEAYEIYEKIKELLYSTDLKYFDHKIERYGTSSSGFRNRLNDDVS